MTSIILSKTKTLENTFEEFYKINLINFWMQNRMTTNISFYYICYNL